MKSGFTLIEVLVATAVASIMGGLLFSVLNQASRSVAIVERVAEVDSEAIMIMQQLTRDLSGAFIPVQYRPPQPPDQKKPQQQPAQQQQEQKEKPVTYVFYGENKDGNLDVLTCVTDNPLPIYPRGDMGVVKPRVVRVVYRLKREFNRRLNKEHFVLYRQEGSDLDYAQYTHDAQGNKRAFRVADTVKRMKVDYTVDMQRAQSQDGQQQKELPAQERFKTLPSWNVEQEGGNQTLLKAQLLIPQLVNVELVLWDDRYKRDKKFDFAILIEPHHRIEKEKKKEKEKTPTEKAFDILNRGDKQGQQQYGKQALQQKPGQKKAQEPAPQLKGQR